MFLLRRRSGAETRRDEGDHVDFVDGLRGGVGVFAILERGVPRGQKKKKPRVLLDGAFFTISDDVGSRQGMPGQLSCSTGGGWNCFQQVKQFARTVFGHP